MKMDGAGRLLEMAVYGGLLEIAGVAEAGGLLKMGIARCLLEMAES